MPYKPKKPCKYPGCPNLVDKGSYCEKHKKIVPQDDSRPSASQRGYDYRWQRARKMYLRRNPLCVECLKEGRVTGATVVDHIIPHKGDYDLFWDENNWQALCEYHHNKKTAKGY